MFLFSQASSFFTQNKCKSPILPKYVNNNVILKSKYQNRTGNLSTFENCLAMFSSQIIKNNLIKSNILLSYKLLLVLQFAKNKQIMIHVLLIAS